MNRSKLALPMAAVCLVAIIGFSCAATPQEVEQKSYEVVCWDEGVVVVTDTVASKKATPGKDYFYLYPEHYSRPSAGYPMATCRFLRIEKTAPDSF